MSGKVLGEAFEGGTVRGDGSDAVSSWGHMSSNPMSSEVKPNSSTTIVVMLCKHLDRFSSSSSTSRVKQFPYSSSF